MKYDRQRKRAALLLLVVFGISVSVGLMAEHQRETLNVIRSSRPDREKRPIKAPRRESPRAVVVAVIDTGIDFGHPALTGNAWINPGESGLDAKGRDRRSNGIDDDGNGYVDDVNGFDFAEQHGAVVDTHGHGTHIAGIIVRNAPHVKLVNLKYFNRNMSGAEALSNSLKAMRYAIAMKVDIINYSGGGTVPNREELSILSEASRQGILVVAAAGNESANSETEPFYPANYDLPNILSVTAIDEDKGFAKILPSSNFGSRSVAVAAEGKNIISTLPGGTYGSMTGTSQATAFVTAAAANIIVADENSFENKSLLREGDSRRSTAEFLIQRLLVSSRASKNLVGKTRFGSTLAAPRALEFRNENPSRNEERQAFTDALKAELSDVAASAKINPYGL